jgi:chromosome segregation ATPase
MKKRGTDHRVDPTGGISNTNRIDRVFAPHNPPPQNRPITSSPEVSALANDLLAATRAPTTDITSAAGGADSELSLRRSLSRLQRQLSESQRELANKDDELATEVEKRLEITQHLEQHVEVLAQMQARLDEYVAWAARVQGIDERLQEQIALSDDLVQQLDREKAATAAAQAKVEELNKSFEETRALWNAERTMLEERMANEIATLDGLRKAAVDASAEALNAQAARLREAQEAQLAELRSGHQRSLDEIRGDLEPKAAQLAEERDNLIAELSTVRNEAIRETVELEQEYSRELAQAIEAKDSELAAQARAHAAELARAISEREAQIIGLQQAVKAAETQCLAQEGQTEAVRHTLKTAQRELAEAKEKIAAAEADKRSVQDQLAATRANVDKLIGEKRQLQTQIDAAHDEVRRSADERRRFVAYLEEGLAFLGALPPKQAPEPEVIETIETIETEQIVELEPDD